jgi:hypothetical protein
MKASALLPLHHGKAPRWLFGRMVKLAECIVDIVIDNYGIKAFLERVSDPWFFQSLSCVLGYDWHSSGTTTVTCGALKEAINPRGLGLIVAGGKGKTSRKTPAEIEKYGSDLGLNSGKIEALKYASRLSAKVDNCLVQDGYSIYHHCLFFTEGGDWIVIQQGINDKAGNARRYHWPPDNGGYIEEPQKAILCDTKHKSVLNMTHKMSGDNRQVCVDLANENPRRLRRMLVETRPRNQSFLDDFAQKTARPRVLVMPTRINWEAMEKVYEFQPSSYEELISLRGVGPSTVRGLSLVAELVYGQRPSWRDPVRFSFAFGGKDGVPFPVDRRGMDEAVEVLRAGISEARLGDSLKMKAVERLRRCVPPIPQGRML